MKPRRGQMRSNLLPVRLDALGKPDRARLWGMLDNLSRPPKLRLNPVLTFPFAVVASIQPDMTKPRKLGCSPIDEEHHSIAIHNVGGMNFGFKHEALRIHKQMTLAPFDFLACIIPARSAQSYCFDALTVDDACTGLCFASHLQTHPLPKHRMNMFPKTISSPQASRSDTPFSKEADRGEVSARRIHFGADRG